MILQLDAWIFWLALLAIFLIAEAVTVNLTTIWFAAGSLVALVLDLAGMTVALQVTTIKLQIFGHNAAWVVNQSHNRQRADGLTRTRFPNNANHFTLVHTVANAVHGAEFGTYVAEVHR